MYYYILFLTSLKPNHRFDSNFVWMFLVWTPTKFVKIWVLPLVLWDFGSFCVTFCQLLKILILQDHSPDIIHIFDLESSQ